jgi:hypothetical protein
MMNRPWPAWRDRYRDWEADMTLRHAWFRVLLHLLGMIRHPRNWRWHWRHILGEVHGRDSLL